MQIFKLWLRLAAVALVAAALLVPAAVYFRSWRESSVVVRRLSAKSSLDPVAAWLVAFESHFSGNYGSRNTLITAANSLRYRLFHVSPVNNVVLGKNGWLFYYSDTDGAIIPDYRRSNLDPPENLEKLRRLLVERRDLLKQHGVEYVIMVAPNKGAIYPEYLPDYLARFSGPDRYDALMGYLAAHTDLHVVNVKRALLEAKRMMNYPLYEINGTRWNDLGAFVAYGELSRVLKSIYPAMAPKQLSDFSMSETNCVRDLERMLAVKAYSTPVEPVLGAVNMLSNNFGAKGVVSFVNPVKRPGLLPRTIVFRDCFCGRLATYLADDCERFDSYGTLIFDWDVIVKNHPGLVIQELVTRYLDDIYLYE